MRIFRFLSVLPFTLCLACTDKGGGSSDTEDADGDGFTASEDCDDDNASIYPGADEVCADAIDNDCDGEIDEADAIDAVMWYADADEDGYGSPDTSLTACEMPEGYVLDATDCDDSDVSQFPGADETCNQEDDDCDEEVDEAGALDESTWYLDADGDGYGREDETTQACDMPSGYAADGTDCDDERAHVNPMAEEICDGLDTDCNEETSEDGLVSIESSTGEFWDVSADFEGEPSAPATPTFDEEGGTYWFCEGVHMLNGRIDTNVTLASMNASPDTTVLYGGNMATVLSMTGDGLIVEIQDLSIMNGSGSETIEMSDGAMPETGGGLFCSGESSLALDGVILSQNDAGAGGAIALDECSLELQTSIIESNTATNAAGIMAINSDISMNQSYISENEVNGVASAIYMYADEDALNFEMNESLISDNIASTTYGGSTVALAAIEDGSIRATCFGSTDTEAGFIANEAAAYPALVLASNDGGEVSFDSFSCDWGTEADGTDNDPADIMTTLSNGSAAAESYAYRIGDDYDISCADNQCGNSSVFSIGSSDTDGSTSGGFRGNVFLAESTETIDDFSVLVLAEEECEVDLYLLSRSTVSGTWDVLHSHTEEISTGYSWVDSGIVGIPVDEGGYYAFAFGWDCDLTYYYDANGATTLDGGFGTSVGRWFESSYDTYSSSATDGYDATDYRYYMNITVSR